MKRISLAITLYAFTCFTAFGQVVTLDYYFNHEVHVNKAGQVVRFHYTWEDTANTGFSIFGEAFKKNGAKLDTLGIAPTYRNLKASDVYIIVDPDTRKESADPKYIEQKDITEIVKWVRKGGVLLLMANDSANVELPHFNKLAARFGMHFNDDLENHVTDDNHFEDGAVMITGNPVFKTAEKVFLKDICSIGISGVAKPVLINKNNKVIIAMCSFGTGTVLAVGDPWLYNEYINGRLPKTFENDKAADDLSKWLLAKTSK